jgi:hypothetical protein
MYGLSTSPAAKSFLVITALPPNATLSCCTGVSIAHRTDVTVSTAVGIPQVNVLTPTEVLLAGSATEWLAELVDVATQCCDA